MADINDNVRDGVENDVEYIYTILPSLSCVDIMLACPVFRLVNNQSSYNTFLQLVW